MIRGLRAAWPRLWSGMAVDGSTADANAVRQGYTTGQRVCTQGAFLVDHHVMFSRAHTTHHRMGHTWAHRLQPDHQATLRIRQTVAILGSMQLQGYWMSG